MPVEGRNTVRDQENQNELQFEKYKKLFEVEKKDILEELEDKRKNKIFFNTNSNSTSVRKNPKNKLAKVSSANS